MPKELLTPEQMDNAAEAAREELVDMGKEIIDGIANMPLSMVTRWWKKWYLLAGHKRLGRILMVVK